MGLRRAISQGMRGSVIGQCYSNSTRESSFVTDYSQDQWRRRGSVAYEKGGSRQKQLETWSHHLLILLALNAVVYLLVQDTTVSIALLGGTIGYFLKDFSINNWWTARSKNRSLMSELLVAVLRRKFTTEGFQESFRQALCRLRANDDDYDFQPPTVEWPADLIIRKLSKKDMEAILKKLLLYPKTRDLDPFVCFLGMALAQRDPSYYDDMPLVNPVGRDENLELPTHSILDINVPLGWLDTERGPTSMFGRFMFRVISRISLWLMDTLELFEEVKSPMYFDNVEEAAVFFLYNIRPHLPKTSARIACINEEKDVHGSAQAHAFAGVGIWRMKAVQGEGAKATWNKREASSKCVPPPGSVAVCDTSWLANMKVRVGYVEYGSAAFFGKKKELLGIWNETEQRMTLPPAGKGFSDEPWRWEQYHWKSCVAYEVFSVGHLLEIHWSASNTLVQVARDLSIKHPIRRLIKPFTWGSAFINFQAMVNLVQTSGAIVRTGAVSIEGISDHFEHLMKAHVHYGSFDKYIEKMGNFPAGYLDDIPMIQDGREVWNIFETFVDEYMKGFFRNQSINDSATSFLPAVEEDEDLQKFWKHARTARSEKYPIELGNLTYDNLKEFLTWGFFWSCAVHNLMANFFPENSLPVSFGGRIGASVRRRSPPSGFQVPINTWLTQTFVLANTTIERVPFLIEAARDTADFFGPDHRAVYGRDDDARRAFVRFADRLEAAAAVIDKRNESRGFLATNQFNPKVMRCSTSL